MADIYGTVAVPTNFVAPADDISVRTLIENLQEEMGRTNKLMVQMQSFLFGPDISDVCNAKEPPKNLCDDIRRLLELAVDTTNRAESVMHILGA